MAPKCPSPPTNAVSPNPSEVTDLIDPQSTLLGEDTKMPLQNQSLNIYLGSEIEGPSRMEALTKKDRTEESLNMIIYIYRHRKH